MSEISKPNLVVRVSEFSSSKAVDIELPSGCTVLHLKQLVEEKHERKPEPSCQRLVLLGRPLNDDTAAVVDLIQAKGIDPATVTTIHLVISDPATRKVAGTWTSAPSTTTRPTTSLPASTPSESAAAASASTSSQSTAPTTVAGSAGTAATPSSAAGISDQDNTTNTTQSQAAFPTTASQTTAGPRHSSSRTHTRPVTHRPMMHPIMAAAYNAALVELSNSSCNQQRTFANVTSASGRQQSIPFALSTPLHLSDPHPHMNHAAHGMHGANSPPAAPPGQTIVINTNSVHLAGNNAESLANLISRANVRLRVLPNGQRVPAGAGAGGAAGAAAAAAAAGQVGGQVPRNGAADGFGGGMAGPAFQQQPGGGWRLQLQFQLNLMHILRLGMVVLFMHSVMQMSTFRIVLLLTGYFVGRALIGMRVHHAFTNWLDSVIAYTRQPMGRPQPVAAQPAAAGARDGAAAEGGADNAAGGAGTNGEPRAAGGAQGPAPAAQPPQAQARPGILLQIWVGILSFFLSMLPQYNADGADAAAIAAAQEDLDNAAQNNAVGNQAPVF